MARKTPDQATLTRQQIIEAAARVFSRDGIAGSSLESIAREAGVTWGSSPNAGGENTERPMQCIGRLGQLVCDIT